MSKSNTAPSQQERPVIAHVGGKPQPGPSVSSVGSGARKARPEKLLLEIPAEIVAGLDYREDLMVELSDAYSCAFISPILNRNQGLLGYLIRRVSDLGEPEKTERYFVALDLEEALSFSRTPLNSSDNGDGCADAR